jgi:amino acid transporter
MRPLTYTCSLQPCQNYYSKLPPVLSFLAILGVSHASAVVVGTIIGSGIFLVPAEMMQAVGSAKLVYLAWLVGGLLSFFGALTYAELGAMKPQRAASMFTSATLTVRWAVFSTVGPGS